MAPRKGNFSGNEKIFFFRGVVKNDICETEKFAFSRRPEKVSFGNRKNRFFFAPRKSDFSVTERNRF